MSLQPPNPHQQLLLATSRSSMPICISCAVVGNGGISNNSGIGQETDSHDYVLRVRRAVIIGCEKRCGKNLLLRIHSLLPGVLSPDLGTQRVQQHPAEKTCQIHSLPDGS